MESITYPDGKVVYYEYDGEDNVQKITDFNGNETVYEYDKLKNLSKITYPNGFFTVFGYDRNGKVVSVENFTNENKLLTADSLLRNSQGQIFSNDKVSLIAPTFEKSDKRDFEISKANRVKSFEYDKNGNLLGFGDNSFSFDARDNLQSAQTNGVKFSFEYDGQGSRVKVYKNDKERRFVVDNVLGLSKPLAEVDKENKIQRYFVYSSNGLVYSIGADGSLQIYLYDYKGSTQALVNERGEILNTYAYSSYGQILASHEIVPNDYKYLAKYGIITDSDDLIYVRARYYVPSILRWLTLDEFRGSVENPLSLNRYILNQGDPVNYIDINGFNRGDALQKFDNWLTYKAIPFTDGFLIGELTFIDNGFRTLYNSAMHPMDTVSTRDRSINCV